MRRTVTLSAYGAVIVAACALYAIKYDTSRLSAEVSSLAEQVASRQAELSILTAEKANLTRPDRIDRLAKAHLTLRPTAPRQLGSIADLPWRGDPPAAGKDGPPVALQP